MLKAANFTGTTVRFSSSRKHRVHLQIVHFQQRVVDDVSYVVYGLEMNADIVEKTASAELLEIISCLFLGRALDTVADIMTPSERLLTVHPDTSIEEALRILVAGKVQGLPVVDSTSKLLGMISDWDIINLSDLSGDMASSKHTFPAMGESWNAFNELKKRLEKSKGTKVKEIMDEEMTTVSPTASLDQAARLLLDKKRRRLPVVDPSFQLVGIVSRGDILRAALILRRRVQNANRQQILP